MSSGAGVSGNVQGSYGETSSNSRGWTASDRSIPAMTIGEALLRGYGLYQDKVQGKDGKWKDNTRYMPYTGGGLTGLAGQSIDFYNAMLQNAGYGGQLDEQMGVRGDVMGQANDNLLARINGTSPILSPQESALLDQMFNAERMRGMEDIETAARNAAGARGMSISDSPIGNDYLSNVRKFQEDMGSRRAQTGLQMRGQNDALNSDLAKFQSTLAQQAFQNRLNLASGGPNLATGMWQGLSNQRLGSIAHETQNYSNRTTGSNWNVAGGITGGYCVIAAALYGFGTPKFRRARRFIFDQWQGGVADIVRSLYRRYGQAVAWAVEHVPGVRAALTPLFDLAVARG